MGVITYIKNFIGDKNVGSIAPTSNYCIKEVCKDIDLGAAKLAVEFGPGGGVFTKYLLRNTSPDTKVVAIEYNKNFYDELKKDPELQSPRFELIHADASTAVELFEERGLGKADFIISGIPLALLEPEIKRSILKAAKGILREEGGLYIYQFFPPVYKKGEQLSYYLNELFELRRKYFLLPNIPPLYIYESVNNNA